MELGHVTGASSAMLSLAEEGCGSTGPPGPRPFSDPASSHCQGHRRVRPCGKDLRHAHFS